MRWIATVCVLAAIAGRADVALCQALPLLRNAHVRALVTPPDLSGVSTFEYEIENGGASDGSVSSLAIGILRVPDSRSLSASGLSLDIGGQLRPYAGWLGDLGMNPNSVVPTGCEAPTNWNCDVASWGAILFGAIDVGNLVPPGQSAQGFVLRSRGIPGISKAQLKPNYAYVAQGDEASAEDVAAAKAAEEQIEFLTETIGPAAPPLSIVTPSFAAYLHDLVSRSRANDWIRADDVVLVLSAQIDSIEEARASGDGLTARARADQLLAYLEAVGCKEFSCSPEMPLTAETYALLRFNVEYLRSQIPILSVTHVVSDEEMNALIKTPIIFAEGRFGDSTVGNEAELFLGSSPISIASTGQRAWESGVSSPFVLTSDGANVQLSVGAQALSFVTSGEDEDIFVAARAATSGSTVLVTGLQVNGNDIIEQASASAAASPVDILRIQGVDLRKWGEALRSGLDVRCVIGRKARLFGLSATARRSWACPGLEPPLPIRLAHP